MPVYQSKAGWYWELDEASQGPFESEGMAYADLCQRLLYVHKAVLLMLNHHQAEHGCGDNLYKDLALLDQAIERIAW